MKSILLLLMSGTLAFAQLQPGPAWFSALHSTAGGGSWSPSDESGLFAWAKPETLSTNDGSALDYWSDSSGVGAGFRAVASDSRPIYQANSYGTLGAVAFDASNDGLVMATAAQDKPNTLFLLCRLTNAAAATHFFLESTNESYRQGFFYSSGAGPYMYAGSVLGVTYPANTNWTVVTLLFNGADSLCRTNGVQSGSGDAGSGAMHGISLGGYVGGASFALNGIIMEFIAYHGDKTSIFSTVETYLKGRVGL